MDAEDTGDKYLCGNPVCKARGAKLSACSGCKSARYCSSICQDEDWKFHRTICRNNQMRAEFIKETERITGLHGLGCLETQMKRWIRFHSHTFMAALIHALDLPRDIRRVETHLLRLRIRRHHNNHPASSKWQTLFSIEDITVLEQSGARLLGPVWKNGLDQISAIRVHNEEGGRGTVGVLAIQCEPFDMYFVPIGSLKDLDSVRVLHGHWMSILNYLVSKGEKFVSFERPAQYD